MIAKKIYKKIKTKLIPSYNSPLRNKKGKSFVFIHINKTGGTSIGKAIGLPSKRHLTAKEIINIIGNHEWRKAYKFTVIRNPWGKVVSHYRYRIKTDQTSMGERTLPFNEWVKRTYGRKKDPFYYDITKMFQPQVDWLKDFEGKIRMDKIINFKKLEIEYKEVAKILNLKKELPHLNKTKKNNYKYFYDKETKDIVAQWFKEDIERFGFKFE